MKPQNSENKRNPGKRFQPGKSGNPGGRPKDTAASYLTAKLSKEEWADKVVRLAKGGSLHALTLYASYVFGKPQESVNLSGGISLYEQGAGEQEFDKRILLEAMKRLGGTKK